MGKGEKFSAISKTQIIISASFNSLPSDKILDQSKLKGFSEDEKRVTEKLKFVWERVENIVGKGEKAGYQYFLLFPQCFQNTYQLFLLFPQCFLNSFYGIAKLPYCMVKTYCHLQMLNFVVCSRVN